jgi:hypothetical protein
MINMNLLKKDQSNFDFREKRPGIHKMIVPFFHEDGDMYDIFAEENPFNGNLVRVSDYGLTLMKLSYTFEIDTENKRNILESIISQNKCSLDDGLIYVDVYPDQFQAAVYLMAQVISKVSNMDIISREMIKSMFYDLLKSFINEKFSGYDIKNEVTPLTNEPDYVVDYEISTERPIYLFGVRDDSKASKVIISCLEFNNKKLPYQSLAVHENFDGLNPFNRRHITNAVDKQFTNLDEFKDKGEEFLLRAV